MPNTLSELVAFRLWASVLGTVSRGSYGGLDGVGGGGAYAAGGNVDARGRRAGGLRMSKVLRKYKEEFGRFIGAAHREADESNIPRSLYWLVATPLILLHCISLIRPRKLNTVRNSLMARRGNK